MKFNFILAIGGANCYGMNLCRDFKPEQIVQNFEFKSFMGEWFPVFESVVSPYTTGRCPNMHFWEL